MVRPVTVVISLTFPDFVVTATAANEPLIKADWLHPGLHITAMGSDQEGKNEIEPAALGACDLYACDRVSQAALLGELRAARAAGFLLGADPPELGQIAAGSAEGRTSDQAVTICDLTGTGAQDTAIANHAFAMLSAAGMGFRIAT